MIDDLALAIPIASLCVLVSAFCSGTEVALFLLRRVEREQLGRSDRAVDRSIARLLERPRRVIATVLIGNEACAGVLATIAFAVCLQWWHPWAAAGIALAIALPLTALVMEVTAKTLAAKAPLAWARAFALLFRGFALLVTPARLVIGGIASLLLRPLGEAARARPTRDLSEEEFRKLVDAGSAQGQVDARERRLIHRVFEFSDTNVGQVMTPRDRIFALSYDLPMQRIAREVAARGFSRVPIYQKSLDNVRGIINAKDLVRSTSGAAKPLGALLHEPLFVPRTTPVKRLFLTFKSKKVHMAIVVSEYGKVLGLVTMDDVLAQIFGVLRDERTALQDSIQPARTIKPRTPPSGVRPPADAVPTEAPSVESAPVVDAAVVQPVRPGDATGPVRIEDATGPVMRADSDAGPSDALDPPPRPHHRETYPEIPSDVKLRALADVPPGLRPSAELAVPIFPPEELTPPAVDQAELEEKKP